MNKIDAKKGKPKTKFSGKIIIYISSTLLSFKENPVQKMFKKDIDRF